MEPSFDGNGSPKPAFAHYYGDWFWKGNLTEWIKSLLLFFDGVALALPASMASHFIESDPYLAQPLAVSGLLRNYPPDLWLDQSLLRNRPRILDNIYQSQASSAPFSTDEVLYMESAMNALDAVESGNQEFDFQSSTNKYARLLVRAWGQFGESQDFMQALSVGVSSRLLWRTVTDVAIQPVIDRQDTASFVASIIGSSNHSIADIVTSDLAHINLNLSAVPLDEVLDFRRQHGSAYRAYSEEVRQYVLTLSLIPEVERPFALQDRHAALDDKARELRQVAKSAFRRKTMSLSFGLAGAAWTLVHGDPWGAMFAAGATAAGLSAPVPSSIGAAYTYVIRAGTELGR